MTGNEENHHTMAPHTATFKELHLMLAQNQSASSEELQQAVLLASHLGNTKVTCFAAPPPGLLPGTNTGLCPPSPSGHKFEVWKKLFRGCPRGYS